MDVLVSCAIPGVCCVLSVCVDRVLVHGFKSARLWQDRLTFRAVGSKVVGKWTSLQLLCLVTVGFGFLKIVEVSAWTYHYSTKVQTWNESRNWCRRNFTDMVAIQNKEEISFLIQNLPEDDIHYWIGLRKINQIWIWIGTNKSLTKHEENWAQGEPNNKKKNQDCVEIYIRRSKESGKWNDEQCDKKKRVLCYLVSCNDSSCNKHGDCVETVKNYTCKCWPGFYGANCENAVSCRSPHSPPHGEIICTVIFGTFQYNSVCNFSCEEGFQLTGARSLSCQNSGEWSESIPRCKAVSCSPLEDLSHGHINCSDEYGEYRFKSICEFTCEVGFQLKGSNSLFCQSSGEWSEPTPQCIAVSCMSLQSPEHGKVNCSYAFGEYRYKSICNITCEEGFDLQGSTSLLCQNTGEWSESTPICLAHNVSLEKQRQSYTEAYVLTSCGLILSGLMAYGINYYRKKKNPGLLKKDKDNTNTFENPAFEDHETSFDQ
ncbi:L-selectin-like [Bufo gargarizans]|uniref:L-selectin-like n=1 Tax=Bufo gargarizans TaxID=30331 RepID=UPI001CF5C2DE|nr:L-selectin-like [Bufo gargarizans]